MQRAILMLLVLVSASAVDMRFANRPEVQPKLKKLPRLPPTPANVVRVATESSAGRIVQGSEAAEGQFPFQAGLMIDGSGFCGGSLITTTAVLTAAHCVDAGSFFTVLLGTLYPRPTSGDNSQSFSATDAVRHSGFYTPDGNAAYFDVGLIRWPEPIIVTAYVTPIRLPSRSQASETFAGWDGIASGWGLTSNSAWTVASRLMYVDVQIWSNSDCQNIYGDLVDDNAVCAMGTNGQHTCNGDSGGPLSVVDSDGQRTQVGLVSWGTAEDCESPNPDVFMRVSAFLDWIQENAGITIS